jgi:hypothetical protein
LTLNFDGLFEEAVASVATEKDNLRKFEQSCLLDGMRDYLSRDIQLSDVLSALTVFETRFGVSKDKTDRARDEYLTSYIFDQLKSSGYKCEVDQTFLKRVDLSAAQASAALDNLSKQGFVVTVAKGRYRATAKIWSQDIQSFRDRVMRMDSELGQLLYEKSKDWEKIGWNYLNLLSKILPMIDSLIAFNEPRIAEMARKRVFDENAHFRKHHAGRWTQEMVGKFRANYRSYFESLPIELRIEQWPT